MSDEVRARELAAMVAAGLADVLDERLTAVYLHGSAVLGGFRWDRSDLDLLAVTQVGLSDADLTQIVAGLASHEYPANGLELSVLTEDEARAPHCPAPLFELHVGTEGWDRRLKVVDGRRRGGDPDLVLHLLVCLLAGEAVIGPTPDTVLTAPPVDAVRRAVVEEIDWSLANDPPPEYVVLTAARAWCYFATGQVLSKVDAGGWTLRQLPAGGEAAATVDAAVARQTGSGEGPTRRQADAFAREVLAGVERTSWPTTKSVGRE